MQKTAVKIILGTNYIGYKKALLKLDIDDLSTRRENLCLDFAVKTTKHPRLKNMFPTIKKSITRKPATYFVQHANTKRLQQSSIIYMQNLLNDNKQRQEDLQKQKY